MKLKLIGLFGLLAILAACATYSEPKRHSSNYTFEGKTYAVWTSTKTEGGRSFPVFLLTELNAKPLPHATINEQALGECTSRDIRVCEQTFGTILRRPSSAPRDEGGMGY